MTILYGIKNCDTVKKAKKWLDANNVAYTFHDFRVESISEDRVANWISTKGWQNVVNKRSTSWKQLDSKIRDSMNDTKAISAITNNPTLVKRPVLEQGSTLVFGFTESNYTKLF